MSETTTEQITEHLTANGWALSSICTDQGDYKTASHHKVTLTRNGQSIVSPYTMGAAFRVWSRSVDGNWPAHDRDFTRAYKKGEPVPLSFGGVSLWTEERLLKYTEAATPTLTDVLWSLVSDSSLVRYGQSFDEFCDELGLDNDSIKARDSYDACTEIWRGLVRMVADLDQLSELFQDY